MQNATTITLILIGGISLLILLVPLSPARSSDQNSRTEQGVRIESEIPATDGAEDRGEGESVQPPAETTSEKRVTSVDMPVYRPPLRGAPVGRIAGGSRGILDEFPALLVVLSPAHTGLTVQGQPSLYWFLTETVHHPLEFTLIKYQAVYPVLETRIPSPEQPGVQRIRLADYGLRLQTGVQYQWFIALVPDPGRRSKDILAWGAIERVEPTVKLQKDLAHEDLTRRPHIYAEAGLWYDALSAISELIEASPENMIFRQQRASLLEQVGLPQIASYDLQSNEPGNK